MSAVAPAIKKVASAKATGCEYRSCCNKEGCECRGGVATEIKKIVSGP